MALFKNYLLGYLPYSILAFSTKQARFNKAPEIVEVHSYKNKKDDDPTKRKPYNFCHEEQYKVCLEVLFLVAVTSNMQLACSYE